MRELANAWYDGLVKPALTPPNWIFGPVWTVLYIAIVISIVIYYRSRRKEHVGLTSLVLSVHLAANFIWTYLFFGLHCPGAALVDIIVLDVTLVLLIRWFLMANRASGLLLVPYLIWVLFATYLNGGFYWLN